MNFLKQSTTEGISVFSPVAERPVTKSRGSWRMDVGEMVEMEGVPLGLDEFVLTADPTGFDKVQVIILQSNLQKILENVPSSLDTWMAGKFLSIGILQ